MNKIRLLFPQLPMPDTLWATTLWARLRITTDHSDPSASTPTSTTTKDEPQCRLCFTF